MRTGIASRHHSHRLPRLVVLVCLAAAAMAGAAPQVGRHADGEHFAGMPAAPAVEFGWDGPAGEKAAAVCRETLAARGGEIVAAVGPAFAEPQPVVCLLLGTSTFQSRFAGRLPDWGVGAALPDGRLIAIDHERQPAVGRSLGEVFLHELTHALIHQVIGEVWMPTWFHEGTAMWLSGEWRFTDTVHLVLNGSVPELIYLEGRFPAQATRADQAYRTSLLAVEFLRRWYGEDVLRRLVHTTAESEDFGSAFVSVTGESPDVFAARFARAVHSRFGWLIMLTRWPALFTVMAVLFAVGAVARVIRTRRRLAEMSDDPPTYPHH